MLLGLESGATKLQVSLKSYARVGAPAVCADFIFSKLFILPFVKDWLNLEKSRKHSGNGFLKEILLTLIYCLLPPSFWAERLDPRIVGAGSLMPHLPQWPHTPPPPPRPCMHPLVGNIWVDNFFQQGYFLNSCSNKSLLPSCDNLLMLHKTRVMQKKWKYQTFPLVIFTL